MTHSRKSVTIVHCSRGGFGAGIAKTVGDRLRSRGCDVRVVSARSAAGSGATVAWTDPDVVVAISPIYFRMIPRAFKQFFRRNAFGAPTGVGDDDADLAMPEVVPLVTAGRPTNGAARRRLGKFFGAHGWRTLHPGFDLAAMAPRGVTPDAEIDAVVDAIATTE